MFSSKSKLSWGGIARKLKRDGSKELNPKSTCRWKGAREGCDRYTMDVFEMFKF